MSVFLLGAGGNGNGGGGGGGTVQKCYMLSANDFVITGAGNFNTSVDSDITWTSTSTGDYSFSTDIIFPTVSATAGVKLVDFKLFYRVDNVTITFFQHALTYVNYNNGTDDEYGISGSSPNLTGDSVPRSALFTIDSPNFLDQYTKINYTFNINIPTGSVFNFRALGIRFTG